MEREKGEGRKEGREGAPRTWPGPGPPGPAPGQSPRVSTAYCTRRRCTRPRRRHCRASARAHTRVHSTSRQNTGRSSRLCLNGRDRRGAWRRGTARRHGAPCTGRTTRVYATCSSLARSLTPFFSSPPCLWASLLSRPLFCSPHYPIPFFFTLLPSTFPPCIQPCSLLY